jgi:hypothetical protein
MDQFVKRARRLTSRKPVTFYVILPTGSISAEKWRRLKQKTASSDLALDGKLSSTVERPIDQAQVIRELSQRGARIDGTEIPEAEVERMWTSWTVGEAVSKLKRERPPAPILPIRSVVRTESLPGLGDLAAAAALQRARPVQLGFEF